MTLTKKLYGIIFFMVWAVVGWIKEVAKCAQRVNRGDRMEELVVIIYTVISWSAVLMIAYRLLS